MVFIQSLSPLVYEARLGKVGTIATKILSHTFNSFSNNYTVTFQDLKVEEVIGLPTQETPLGTVMEEFSQNEIEVVEAEIGDLNMSLAERTEYVLFAAFLKRMDEKPLYGSSGSAGWELVINNN